MAAKLWRNNKLFLVPVLIFLMAGILFTLLFPKPEIHLFLNQYHSAFGDVFFTYITYLGDGLIYAFAALFLIFHKWRYLFGIALNGLLVLLLVNLGKQVLFTDYHRPVHVFEEQEVELYLVDDVKIHRNNSFPSGHTTTAFAVWGFVAFLIRRKPVQVACFVIALLAGYSRIYLSQHFLADVVVGAALGTLIALFSWWFSEKINRSWADKSVRTLFN